MKSATTVYFKDIRRIVFGGR